MGYTPQAVSLHPASPVVVVLPHAMKPLLIAPDDLPSEAFTSARPRPVEPRTLLEATLAWAHAVGVKPGSSPSPSARQLVPIVHEWCAAQGWGIRPDNLRIGHAFSALGVRSCQFPGGNGFRVPKHLADSWWARFGGRPRLVRRKVVRRQRNLPELFHHARNGPSSGSRPLVNGLWRIYPSLGAAAQSVKGGGGKAAELALSLRLKAVREGRHAWVYWRGTWWRYLTEEELAAVPYGTRVGTMPEGWGFGLVLPPGEDGAPRVPTPEQLADGYEEVRGDGRRNRLKGLRRRTLAPLWEDGGGV